jgi:hypothetical protein
MRFVPVIVWTCVRWWVRQCWTAALQGSLLLIDTVVTSDFHKLLQCQICTLALIHASATVREQ